MLIIILINRDNGQQQFSPNEISFAVKQLLMKYLPSEELVKINDNTKHTSRKNDCLIKGSKRLTELSAATLQYMKKYNLLEKGMYIVLHLIICKYKQFFPLKIRMVHVRKS